MSKIAIPVGLLRCQADPFCKVLETTVVSCSVAPNADGLYEVVLADTVIFPEGGGQPTDTGKINGIEVRYAKRKGLTAVHYTKAPLLAGEAALVEVDFRRRQDHMQQHSGQHLLSAILKKEHGLETSSWSMGAEISHVELKTSKQYAVKPELLAAVEDRCNDLIFAMLPMSVRVSDQDAVGNDAPSSLPEDYIGGVVRCVEIRDSDGDIIDQNACCGTHVTCTAQLQVLKLAGTDRVRGGNTRLFFYVGDRVRRYANGSFLRDRRLTELLSCPPASQSEAVERLVKQNKTSLKMLKNLRQTLAPLIAQELYQRLNSADCSTKDGLRFVAYHCEDGDGLFVSNSGSQLFKLMVPAQQDPWLAVIAAGKKTEGGPLVVVGSSKEVMDTALESLAALLGECKGGFTRGIWQGKADSFAKLARFLG